MYYKFIVSVYSANLLINWEEDVNIHKHTNSHNPIPYNIDLRNHKQFV